MTFDNRLPQMPPFPKSSISGRNPRTRYFPEKQPTKTLESIFSLQPIGTCSKNMYLFQTLPYRENNKGETRPLKACHD
jgi:hypothetical protein